jgi:type II secretory pathway predicted ATPase ExeA
MLTGEPGVGKTAVLRHLTRNLNPHRYQTIYLAETEFGRVDLYRSLARSLGLEPSHRRADLWRDIKARITELANGKQVLSLWIIDEAQNLPPEFFRDFPSFLNFAFDARHLITVWLVGHPELASMLERNVYAALYSRIQTCAQLQPVTEHARFAQPRTHSRPPAATTRCSQRPGSSCCAKPRVACPATPDASCAPPCSWPCPRG